MKILLTSGGTRTKIDEVRHVGNLSSGTFGRHLCNALLWMGHDVTFLYAKGSKCPHELRLDLRTVGSLETEDALAWFLRIEEKYHPIAYDDFDDYAAKLKECLKQSPEVVVLAAAVSDYAPVPAEGKISSELDEMTIRMVKTPKLIRGIREVLPKCFLVGFKLLVDSTDEQLEHAMGEQKHKAAVDLVVGNDLRDIKANQHKLTLLGCDGHIYELGPKPGSELATDLAKEIIRDAETMQGKYDDLGAWGWEWVHDERGWGIKGVHNGKV